MLLPQSAWYLFRAMEQSFMYAVGYRLVSITKEIYIICYYMVNGEGTSCIDQDYYPFKDARHRSPL
jgi:hypothetical protein